MLLLQHSCTSLNKRQKVCGMRLSGRCHKFRAFTGSLQKMEHEKVLSGSFTMPTVLFLSFDLCRELWSTYCRPDLGNHNVKYKIMISLQGPYRHYWYSSDTCKTSLGGVCARLKRAHWMGFASFIIKVTKYTQTLISSLMLDICKYKLFQCDYVLSSQHQWSIHWSNTFVSTVDRQPIMKKAALNTHFNVRFEETVYSRIYHL